MVAQSYITNLKIALLTVSSIVALWIGFMQTANATPVEFAPPNPLPPSVSKISASEIPASDISAEPPNSEPPTTSPAIAPPTQSPNQRSPELNFDPPPLSVASAVPVTRSTTPPSPQPKNSSLSDTVDRDRLNPDPLDTDDLFAGGTNSLVARTVGHAEGTRGVDGAKTPAYYGHTDPGNGVWNLGSFSYQHCNTGCTPEEADRRQLRRLQQQTQVLKQRAVAQGLELSLPEKLNAIDLANQAPLAALDRGGYIDWLKAARDRGLTGSDAVLWARVNSYRNPHTQTWDAPGLGNNYASIEHDQDRRQRAIARALAVYQQQARITKRPQPTSTQADAIADRVISQNLSH